MSVILEPRRNAAALLESKWKSVEAIPRSTLETCGEVQKLLAQRFTTAFNVRNVTWANHEVSQRKEGVITRCYGVSPTCEIA